LRTNRMGAAIERARFTTARSIKSRHWRSTAQLQGPAQHIANRWRGNPQRFTPRPRIRLASPWLRRMTRGRVVDRSRFVSHNLQLDLAHSPD
jgi:hypothetical protein